MVVQQVAPGLWRWTAPHPEWTPESDWPRDVGCVYAELPEHIVLVDPLVPAGEEARFWKALDRDVERLDLPVSVLRTVSWHERSVDEVAARYGGSVWRSASDGDLPAGVVGFHVAAGEDEVVFWLDPYLTLVPGDLLISKDGTLRLCPQSWLPEGRTLEEVRAALAPTLDLPVERVLVSHGEQVLAGAREALAAALAREP
jgi:hypothetical protein